MKKGILALLLAVILVVSALPMFMLSAQAMSGDAAELGGTERDRGAVVRILPREEISDVGAESGVPWLP